MQAQRRLLGWRPIKGDSSFERVNCDKGKLVWAVWIVYFSWNCIFSPIVYFSWWNIFMYATAENFHWFVLRLWLLSVRVYGRNGDEPFLVLMGWKISDGESLRTTCFVCYVCYMFLRTTCYGRLSWNHLGGRLLIYWRPSSAYFRTRIWAFMAQEKVTICPLNFRVLRSKWTLGFLPNWPPRTLV